ncbi:MAG TPA: 2-C-methyl-D-erythritol 4-phosphate cytidylyltransferase [Chlamydiales bacterium]|jgi:2-C-methyl-D-erythritol 4-phosphate cytidylyltransferase|nr:2-C-methyl-D-erythritol 4-phosphate cytidylyltransferase [Chlamydiales bacterium]
MNQKKFISLIFLAGGKGSRFGAPIPKQFLPLRGKPIVRYSLELFDAMEEISEIVAVVAPVYRSLFERTQKAIVFAEPGPERWNSVYNGFKKCSPHSDLVLAHDSARPFVDKETVLKIIEAALRVGAAAAGRPMINTIKQCSASRMVEKTVDRSRLWEMQTPQALKPDLFERGFSFLRENSLSVTDELSLVELLGEAAEIVPASFRNFKITTPFDWKLAEFLETADGKSRVGDL